MRLSRRKHRKSRWGKEWRSSVEGEVEEEIAYHLERRCEELCRSGVPIEEARRTAMREFGDVEAVRRYCSRMDWARRRQARRRAMFLGVWQDLRYAARQLRRRPGVSLLAVLTLALGIGSNAAIFSVLDTVLLRPLPFQDPDRLVRVWNYNRKKGRQGSFALSYPDFRDLAERQQLLDGLAAWRELTPSLSGGQGRQALRLQVTAASRNLLPLLGIEPALGRSFSAEEAEPGGPRTAVLSHAFWQSYMGGADDVLGRSLLIDGQSYSVIGVLPSWFRGDTGGAGVLPSALTQVWLPYRNSPAIEGTAARGLHNVSVLGRLKQSATLEQANDDAETVADWLGRTYPENSAQEGIWLQPAHQALTGQAGSKLRLLFAAVGIVLLIACSNVANLMLGQFTIRQRELSIRRALGAGKGRILRQVLTESLLLAGLGGAAATIMAAFSIRLLHLLRPDGIPRLDLAALDARVMLFLMAASLLSGVLFGILPAWRSSRRDPQTGLREGAPSLHSSPSRSRLRGSLVVCQVALAVILLIGAGLLVRSFAAVLEVDPGFNPRKILLADVKLAEPFVSPRWPRLVAFFEELTERVRALPGVDQAAVAYQHPMRPGWTNSFEIEGKPRSQPGQRRTAILRPVGPGYFETAGIRLLRGRSFTNDDDARAAGAVIINQTFAQRYFPDEDPLQHRLQMEHWWQARPDEYQIVGIVADVRFDGLASTALPAMYYPHAQWPFREMSLLIKSEADPSALADAVRRQVAAMDPELPVENVMSLEQAMGRTLAERRFSLLLLASFAFLALLLALVGIYGLLSFLVSQRRAEIGLRLAVGARRQDILLATQWNALRMVLAGLALGLIAASALSQYLSSSLFGVGPTDLPTYLFVAAFLLADAFLAGLIPAWRATRIDPISALKCE